jgi:hypothetical protein
MRQLMLQLMPQLTLYLTSQRLTPARNALA